MTRGKLLISLGSVAILLIALAGAWFYFIVTPSPTVTLPGVSYSVKESTVGDILDFSEANKILQRHIPGLSKLRQLEVARALTLEDIQPYYPDMTTDGKLAAVEAELSTLEGSGVVVYTTGYRPRPRLHSEFHAEVRPRGNYR